MTHECQKIHELANRKKKHYFPFRMSELPKNGIYILFENGEHGHKSNRIVRIGTHNGNNQLPSRLKQHFVHENKDRSIFRKNIGRALLNKEKDLFINQWNHDLTSKNAKELYSDSVDFKKQEKIEKKVSKYIQNNFFFVIFEVGSKTERINLESKIISTVSLCEECKPSLDWLGTSSPVDKIRQSGLWQVNELWKIPLSNHDILNLDNKYF